MGKTYIIEYDRDACIGAAACEAVQPEQWHVVDDGKADLKDAEKLEDGKKWRKEVDEAELQLFKEAAESCPVNVIHIIDKETGEKLV